MVGSVSATTVDDLIRKVNTYLPDGNDDLLRRAYQVADKAHAGQTRSSGEPYIQHCLAAADILADLGLDAAAVAAGLLHDTVEDTPLTVDELNQQFGPEVARLVDGVTKLSRISWRSLEDQEAESLRKMFLAMADDIRVVLIKLADRLHNMRTLGSLPEERRQRIAQETLDIFAPLANRLGIWQIKWELEDLALHYLEPDKYQEIRRFLGQRRAQREAYIEKVIAILQERLAAEGVQADITGRPKHIYSIYRKMQRKAVGLEQIYDVNAIRILVHEVRDCYAALGIVHSLWRPIPGEFDDYIATPKDNQYQSLHTAVVGPEQHHLEIQIRTREMHQVAEYGIAAHWRYKEQRKRDVSQDQKIAWLRQLMDWRRELPDAQTFIDALKTDVFQDQVFVFTPRGDIIDLPVGSTPVDFAYHIHTEVGHRCRGAKINGRLVGLDYRLQTGEQVEILTAKQGGPSRDWLNPDLGFIQSSRAREKIKAYFKRQGRAEAIAQGREVLEKQLRRLGLSKERYEDVAALFGFDKVDDFLAAIGYGDINNQQIALKIGEAEAAAAREEAGKSADEQVADLELPDLAVPPLPAEGLTVGTETGLLMRVARCCQPLPGDDVVGFITRGRGITVHRRDCRNMVNLRTGRERLINVDWGMKKGQVYPVVVRVLAFDRTGLIRDIADVVAREGVNMSSAKAETNKRDNTATVYATLEISGGFRQLQRIFDRIEMVTNVVEVKRLA
jgi:GTP pyrophosphokinase